MKQRMEQAMIATRRREMGEGWGWEQIREIHSFGTQCTDNSTRRIARRLYIGRLSDTSCSITWSGSSDARPIVIYARAIANRFA